jgi:hypothetical protein
MSAPILTPQDEAVYWDSLRKKIEPNLAPVWHYRGIRGKGAEPDLLGAYEGKSLIVIGTAPCVYHDLALITGTHDRMATSTIGLQLDNLTHWAELHTEIIPHFAHIRKVSSYFSDRPFIHAHHFQRERDASKEMCDRYIDVYWHCYPLTCGSGLFGVEIGIAMGYEQIICAGMPLDDTGSVAGKHTKYRFTSDYVREQHEAWESFAEIPEFKKRVRSVSGFTKELFGPPDCMIEITDSHYYEMGGPLA